MRTPSLLPYRTCHNANLPPPPHPVSLGEDQFSAQKALQTVVAGQQAENLLYVRASASACVCVLTARSFPRDFDDATSLEGQPSGLAATQVLAQTPAAAGLLAGTSSNPLDDLVSIFGGGGPLAPATPAMFGGGAFGGMGLASAPPTPAVGQTPTAAQPQQEDLLGLF